MEKSPAENVGRKDRFASIRQSLATNPAIVATAKRLQQKMQRKQARKKSNHQFETPDTLLLNNASLDFSSEDNQARSRFKDRYELGDKIGEGAHGIVKKCTDKQSRQLCAVKILTLETEHILYMRTNFIDIKALQHPNIPSYKALFFESKHSRCYLVMDYLPYPSLADTQITSEAELKAIVYQLLLTLSYIHDRKLCHRDIKPQNILYDRQREKIFVIDFGISKKVEERGRKKNMLTPTGTPFYRAPQMLEGGGYDEMVDMWAAGVTVYKLMTGVTPFQSEYHIDTMNNIMKGQVHFHKLKFECSQAPKKFVRRLLKRNIKDRFTAEQALKDVWLLDMRVFVPQHQQFCNSLTFQKMQSSYSPSTDLEFNQSFDESPTKANKKKIESNQQKNRKGRMNETSECSIFGMEESEQKEIPSPELKR